ncbi:hypothetical protein Q3G72_016471 [Acer saccharum]|nr:hypothetical protein Q3G72_016471 [Acer saccharum]
MAVNALLQSMRVCNNAKLSFLPISSDSGGGGGRVTASSNGCNNLTTKNFLRHVESLNNIPSGAGKISQLNAVILGEALASEENDLVCPSKDFSNQALVPSPQKYLEMYKRSIEDPSGFWSNIASEFYWKKKWDEPVCSENLEVSKGNINMVRFAWADEIILFRGKSFTQYNCVQL